MLRKTRHFSALLACSFVGLVPAARLVAQETPAAPAAPVAPATLNRLYEEAEKAFAEKNFDTAASKIQELLTAVGNNKEAPLELLQFNLGLAYLLGDKPAEAETAFTDCLKKFPKGEYASRCYLGVGRACMAQEGNEKKERAIDALKLAATDPKFRTEAGLSLGQVYSSLSRNEEALAVFKSLMGSDIRTPQQTTAAVEVVGLLADMGKLEDLVPYLDRLINQSGVRNAMAWYVNQVIVKADEMVASNNYETALAIYRSIPRRNEIITIQKDALETQRRDVKTLEGAVAREKAAAEKAQGGFKRSNASELLNGLKPAVQLAEEALKVIEDKADLDAALLMRRGRCLYYSDRNEEALVCFRTIRNKFGNSSDAKPAAYAEIVLLNKLKDISGIKALCDAYLRKYPDAENAEQVATLAGEVLVQSGNWAEVGTFYRNLESKFPQSASIDRYVFFQGLSFFQDANFKDSTPIFAKFIKTYPNSELLENGFYYVAMSYFLTNDYKNTLASIKEYLSRFPDGRYAGDLRYRLAFIDFNDKDVDQTDKIIRDLTAFLTGHPEDPSSGSMLCLLGDTYAKKQTNSTLRDEQARFQKNALDAYKKASETDSPDDVIQYALDSATAILQSNKDWAGISDLHGKFLKAHPESALALLSASQVAKMKAREGKGAEAAAMLAEALKARIGDPANEQVEFLIDVLVDTLVPRKKPAEIDADAIDKQLVEIVSGAIKGQESKTSDARLYYARARLMQRLRRADRADLYLKGIATINAKDPSVLSPALLAVSGEILLKLGQVDDAEGMFKRLQDRYKEGNFSDAGPVGLGYVALARKKPEDALKIFDDALTNNAGMARFKEATLGKIEALLVLGKLDEAEKLGLETVGNKMFRGEPAGKAYLLVARVYREKSAKISGAEVDKKMDLLKQAYGTYQRVYTAYKAFPEVCAEAYLQASETARELGKTAEVEENMKILLEDPKFKNTEAYKKASTGTK